MAAIVESVRAVEVGFHVSGFAAGERDGRPVRGAGAGTDSASRSEMNCGKSLVTRARSASKEKTAFVFFVSSWRIFLTFALALMLTGPAWAQLGPPKAEVEAIVDTTAAKPGTDVRAALQVHLPEGYHTNS